MVTTFTSEKSKLAFWIFFSEEKEYIICSRIYWAPSCPMYHSGECRDKSLAPIRVHTHTHARAHTLPNQKRKYAPGTGSEQLSKLTPEHSLTPLILAVT